MKRELRELVLHQLTRGFGRLSPRVERRISAIGSPQELTRFAERILEADSLGALELA